MRVASIPVLIGGKLLVGSIYRTLSQPTTVTEQGICVLQSGLAIYHQLPSYALVSSQWRA